MSPPPVDPSTRTEDHRVKFHVAEFKALKDEVLEDTKTVNTNFQYAATLSGAIIAWLLSTEKHVNIWKITFILTSFVPVLFTILLGYATLAIERRFAMKGEYLKRLENRFGDRGLGWEKHWDEHFRSVRDGNITLWAALILLNLS